MNEQEIIERIERLQRLRKLLAEEGKGLCPADDEVVSGCRAKLGDNLHWAERALAAEREAADIDV